MKLGAKLMATNPPFWSGAIRAFDLMGNFSGTHYRSLGYAGAMARDWEKVMGDMAKAWAVVEPELKAEKPTLG